MEWINNPWIVGIGAGVLSGLVVFFITRYILSSREDREYKQKIDAVNREIITAIKSGIPEQKIPEREVILSLIKSTSRKYGVDSDDVYAPTQIAEELIKEVMDSNFISAGDKNEYCQLIGNIKRDEEALINKNGMKEQDKRKDIKIDSEVRDRLVRDFSLILGMVTSSAVIVFVMLSGKSKILYNLFNDFANQNSRTALLIALTAVVVPVLFTFVIRVIERIEKKAKEKHEENEEREKSKSTDKLNKNDSKPLKNKEVT